MASTNDEEEEEEGTLELHEMEVERFPLDNIELATSSSPTPKISLSPIAISLDDQAVTPLTEEFESAKFESKSDFEIFSDQIQSEVALHRLVAIKRMAKSCKEWEMDQIMSALPHIKETATDKEMIIRQATAETLGPLAQYLSDTKHGKAESLILDTIVPFIASLLKDSMEVRHCATLSLLAIAPLLSAEQTSQYLIGIVADMAGADSHDQKVTGLKLLGQLAPIVASEVCKDCLVPPLIRLSKDHSFRVKKCAVQQYGRVCTQLSNADAELTLFPIFLKLCRDSIWSVRKECAEAILAVSSAISSENRLALVAVMEQFLNDGSRWVRNSAYQSLGQFLSTLTSEQISADFLKYFTSIPHLSSVTANADCTNHCAFNFPAVTLTVGKERWNELEKTFSILSKKNVKCRKTLAFSMHEIAAILGNDLTQQCLTDTIEAFMQDDDDIREGIVTHFWKLLAVCDMRNRVEYTSMLWKLASEPDSNWRFRLYLSKQLHQILKLYNAHTIRQEIVPLIFQLCQDRMADVRYAAVQPIADAINVLMTQSSETNNNLQCIVSKIETLYHSRTYSKRLLYVRIADSCFGKIESALFDELFLEDILRYRDDAIFNVRFGLARFIHKNLARSDKYGSHSLVLESIDSLRHDQEDVEIKRFFMGSAALEAWLKVQKAERDKLRKGENGARKNRTQHETVQSVSTDLSSTDSSIYTSSDSDGNEDSVSINTRMRAVSDQLKDISNGLKSVAEDSPASESDASAKLAIVIDNGSHLIKAGFSGDEVPKVLKRTSAGVIERGVIQSMQEMERLWRDIIETELNNNNNNKSNVLLTETAMNTRERREKMVESMFESFGMNGTAIVNEAVLSLYTFGKTNGISLVCGHGLSQIAAVMGGVPLKESLLCAELAGLDITNHLSHLLRESGKGQQTLLTEDIAKDIKHKYCFCESDTAEQSDHKHQSYELPDGSVIEIGANESYQCTQVLFEPQRGIPQLLCDSVLKCDEAFRAQLKQCCVSGGTAMLKGFVQRLSTEMKLLLPALNNAQIVLADNGKTPIAAWVGGSILAGLDTFSEKWITAKEYQESGANIVCRKEPY